MIRKMKEWLLERSFFSWLEILVLHSYQGLLEFFQTKNFQKYQNILIFFKFPTFIRKTPINLLAEKSRVIDESERPITWYDMVPRIR